MAEGIRNFLLAVAAFLVVLGPLVLIHELGHFIALRLTGVTVLEFGFGFPPRALKLFEWRGTLFTLNWLPIGGFVRPLGEDFVKPVGEESTEKERAAFEAHQAELEALGKQKVKTKSLMEATPWQRIFFLAAGPFANFILAIVLLAIAAMTGLPTPASATVLVQATAKNSPAQVAKLLPGDIITEVNGQPVKLADDLIAAMNASAASTDKTLTLTVKRGDQTLPVTLKTADGTFETFGNGVSDGVVIDSVAEGSPAESVFKPEDRIVKVDDTAITSIPTLKSYIDAHAGSSVTITFIRDGEEKTAQIVPRKNPPQNQGALGVGLDPNDVVYDKSFGISLAQKDVILKNIPASLDQAIPFAWNRTIDVMGRVVTAPVQFVEGKLSPQEARPVGPVGIAQMSQQVALQSLDTGQWFPILSFAALISIALGVTNLLPIPALDGGRILFQIIELVRGKPMDPEREGMVHLVGLMILLGLMLVLVINDLRDPVNLILPK
jgi:regulator of sigma E protease